MPSNGRVDATVHSITRISVHSCLARSNQGISYGHRVFSRGGLRLLATPAQRHGAGWAARGAARVRRWWGRALNEVMSWLQSLRTATRSLTLHDRFAPVTLSYIVQQTDRRAPSSEASGITESIVSIMGTEHEDQVRDWGFGHVFTWSDGP